MNPKISIIMAVHLIILSLFISGCDEFSSKDEYGILQVVEYSYRNVVLTNMVFIVKDTSHLVGFVPPNRTNNFWVLLNPESPPYFKHMPNEEFNISLNQYDVLMKKPMISPEVRDALSLRILKKFEQGD